MNIFKALRILIPFFTVISVYAEMGNFGFKVLNITNLRARTKCSAVLLNTKVGCKAVTNSHCVKGLSIGERNLILTESIKKKYVTSLANSLESALTIPEKKHFRSHLIKAKPSGDIAEIFFDDEWDKSFCESKNYVSKETIYDHQPNYPNTGLPFEQTYCFSAIGYQKDTLNIFSQERVNLDSYVNPEGNLDCPHSTQFKDKRLYSRLHYRLAGLPGLKKIYKVRGVNLAQGMSGGALFSVNNQRLRFEGMSASFTPYQKVSYFISAVDIIDFLITYIDSSTDNYNLEVKHDDTQVASDIKNLKVTIPRRSPRRTRVTLGNQVDSPVSYPQEIQREELPSLLENLGQSKPRIPLKEHSFGDTDQDDVGDEPDKKYVSIPSVTSSIDLTQTRFHHEGAKHELFPGKLIIGHIDSQINGYADLRYRTLNQENLSKYITRELKGYPDIEIRKSIIQRLSGSYMGLTSHAHTNIDPRNQHVNELFFNLYEITPSSYVIRNESKKYKLEISDIQAADFSPTFNDLLRNSKNSRITVNKMKLKVSEDFIKFSYDNLLDKHKDESTDNEIHYRDEFLFKPRFVNEYKEIYLDLRITRFDQSFNDITDKYYDIRELSLKCDNLNFKKLICSNSLMEVGISKGTSLQFRLSHWKKLLSKEAAFKRGTPQLRYYFGQMERATAQDVSSGLFPYINKFKKLFKSQDIEILEAPLFNAREDLVEIPNAIKEFTNCSLKDLSSFSFLDAKGSLFHVIHNKNKLCKTRKEYGAIYDRDFKLIALIKKGRITTDRLELLNLSY